jgi:hypothetical protein
LLRDREKTKKGTQASEAWVLFISPATPSSNTNLMISGGIEELSCSPEFEVGLQVSYLLP